MEWTLYWTILIQVFAALFILAWPVHVVTRAYSSGKYGASRDHAEAVRAAAKAQRDPRR